MPHPAVRQQPGIAAVGERHLLVAHRPAIEQDGIAAPCLEGRERVHDPGPRAHEAVLGGLAELGGLECRTLYSTRREHGDGGGDVEGAR